MRARWWRWRTRQRWSAVSRGAGLYEIQFEDWEAAYPLGLELVRGDHVASLPLSNPSTTVRLEGLAYERRRLRAELLLVCAGIRAAAT